MKRCKTCDIPMATDSVQTADGDMLVYFCDNPWCDEYNEYHAGISRNEAKELHKSRDC